MEIIRFIVINVMFSSNVKDVKYGQSTLQKTDKIFHISEKQTIVGDVRSHENCKKSFLFVFNFKYDFCVVL